MTEMTSAPVDRFYTKDHEWVLVDEGAAIVGITDHAQSALGDITFVELPRCGTILKQSQTLAVVESTKAASDVFAPISGKVSEVNAVLEDAPETINTSPYGEGWICRLSGVVEEELDGLLSARDYEALVRSQG